MKLFKVDTPTPPLREAVSEYKEVLSEIRSVKSLIKAVERAGHDNNMTLTMSELHWAMDSVGKEVVLEFAEKKLEDLVHALASSIECVQKSGATSYEIARELCRNDRNPT